MQRVRMTLGRISQGQNTAASRWLMFSGSQPSRRTFRILWLSLIFAHLTHPSTVLSSSPCAVVSLAHRHFLSHGDFFCAPQPLPTSRCLEPHLERHPLRPSCQHLKRHSLQRQCRHLQHHTLQWRRTAGARGICTAGARGMDCLRNGARFAWRPVHPPCPVCGVQPSPVVVGPLLFLEAVFPFVLGIPLYALSHGSAPGALLCQATCVEVRLSQVHSLRRSCFSRRLGEGCFVWFGVAFTPLSHRSNCRFLRVSRSVPCTKRFISFMSLVVLCSLWNLELEEPIIVSLLRKDFERVQWNLVGAGRHERQDQWKGKRSAYQAVQWCSTGERHHWRETMVASGRRDFKECDTDTHTDCSRVQSPGGIGVLWRQRTD